MITIVKILGGLFLLGCLFFLIGNLASAGIAVRVRRLYSEKVKEPLRILQISDLHSSRYGKKQEKLLEKIKACRPDLIFFTGDTVDDDDMSLKTPILSEIHPAKQVIDVCLALAPTYFVLGNHESRIGDNLITELNAIGIHLLRNRKEKVTVKENSLLIAGIDDPRYFTGGQLKHTSIRERIKDDRNRFGESLVGWRNLIRQEIGSVSDENSLTFLLAHRPEEYELYDELGFDFVFSGHAHGGQWVFPFVGPLYAPHQGLFPKRVHGVIKDGKTQHIISSGLSKKRVPRLFNRHELVVIDLLPEITNE